MIEEIIRPLGFYRQKAKHLRETAEIINNNFGGEIPRSFKSLILLPGIGRKSANVIRAHVWGLPAIM